MTNEIWKSIPSMPHYYASSLGRIKGPSGKVLKSRKNQHGYLTHTCMLPEKRKHKKHNYAPVGVSYMVCCAFHGERPIGLVVAHLDGNKENNRPENLKWCTQKENEDHKIMHGTLHFGEKCYNSKLKEHEVIVIKRMLKNKEKSYQAMANQFDISINCIRSIQRKDSWRRI